MMNSTIKIEHKFVDLIPEKLEENVLYISIEHCTAIHLCICGCRNEVVTPISPRGWVLQFNGKSVTLNPSIGNYSFECKSHYFIRGNNIVFADDWSMKKPVREEKTIIKKKRSWRSIVLSFFGLNGS